MNVGFFKLHFRDARDLNQLLTKYVYYRGETEADIMLQLKTIVHKIGVIEATTITQEEYESNTQI